MSDLSPFEKALAARVLDMASDEYSYHGCNDFELPDTPEARDFLRAMDRWNSGSREMGDGESQELVADGKGRLFSTDWFVMSYLAARLREEPEP